MQKEDKIAYSIYTIFFALIMAIALSGCAGFSQWWSNNKSNLRLAVDIAVAAVVDSHPNDAAAIGKVALSVKNAVADSQVETLGNLDDFIMNQIDLPTLSAPDRAVLRDLVSQLDSKLEIYFEKQGILDAAKQLVAVQEVAQMVLDALGTPAMAQRIEKAKAIR